MSPRPVDTGVRRGPFPSLPSTTAVFSYAISPFLIGRMFLRETSWKYSTLPDRQHLKNTSFYTTLGHMLVSAQHRVTILSRNVIPSLSQGSTKQIGRVPVKTVYLAHKFPITLSTWMFVEVSEVCSGEQTFAQLRTGFSLPVCCRAPSAAMQLASAFSRSPLSAFFHFCPFPPYSPYPSPSPATLPPYPPYPSPSPVPLPCIPLVTRSSFRCPPCFRKQPPPPTSLATAGHSHCSLT